MRICCKHRTSPHRKVSFPREPSAPLLPPSRPHRIIIDGVRSESTRRPRPPPALGRRRRDKERRKTWGMFMRRCALCARWVVLCRTPRVLDTPAALILKGKGSRWFAPRRRAPRRSPPGFHSTWCVRAGLRKAEGGGVSSRRQRQGRMTRGRRGDGAWSKARGCAR